MGGGPVSRERVFSMRLTDEEMRQLDQLVEVHGGDRTKVVRKLIATAPLWSLRMQEPRSPAGDAARLQPVAASTALTAVPLY